MLWISGSKKNLFQRNKLAQRWSFHSIYEAWAAHEMRKGVVQLYIKNNEVIFSLAWNIIFSDNWKVLVLKFLEMKNMVFLSQKVDGNMIFTDYWKVLVLNFSMMGNTVFFESRSWWKRWYLLITEKFLFWTFRWWEILSFFESRSWWKDDIYWLTRSSCFELFGDGKYDLFFIKTVDGKMIFTWSFWAFHDIPGATKYGFSRNVMTLKALYEGIWSCSHFYTTWLWFLCDHYITIF